MTEEQRLTGMVNLVKEVADVVGGYGNLMALASALYRAGEPGKTLYPGASFTLTLGGATLYRGPVSDWEGHDTFAWEVRDMAEGIPEPGKPSTE
jgi:hypothetical protein